MFRAFVILFLLIQISFVHAKASVAVFSTGNDDTLLIKAITQKLKTYYSPSKYIIRNTYDIDKALRRKPKILVCVSSKSAELYIKYKPQSAPILPVIVLSDYSSYQPLSDQLPGSLFLCNVTPAPELLKNLSKFTGTTSPSIGFLFPQSHKDEALLEMHTLQLTGIPVHAKKIPESPTPETILLYLKKLRKKGVSVIRLFGKQELSGIITNSSDIQKYLTDNVSVVISDQTSLHKSLPRTVVVSISSDYYLLGSLTTLIAQAINSSNEVGEDLKVQGTTAALHYGNQKRLMLIKSPALRIKSFIQKSEELNTINSDTVWNDLYTELAGIADTNMSVPRFKKEKYDDTIKLWERHLIAGFTLRDLILIGLAVGLFLILILKIYFRLYKLRKQSPRALLFPAKTAGSKLMKENGRVTKVAKYLKKEKYRIAKVRSFSQYKKLILSPKASLHMIDWAKGIDAVRFLRDMLRKHRSTVPDILIIFNIPHKYQLEIAPRFGEIRLFLFESLPSIEEMDRIFYGSGKQEQYRSYISGQIKPDALPQIFQMLDTNQVTGALLIEDPIPFAAVFYRDGKIVYAEDRTGGIGERSLVNVLSKGEGTYRFEPDHTSPVENSSIKSMDILMKWASEQDEQQR